MFKQSICLTHYSPDFTARLEMLGYEDSKYSHKFSGSEKKTRDDLCICTSIAQFEPDSFPVSYIVLSKEEALNPDPRIGWVNTCAQRYITDNEDLAFALASLKDDDTTDKYQFFTIECNFQFDGRETYKKGTLFFCTRDKWNLDFDNEGNPLKFSSRNVPAHKSTKEEIIEYFEKKNHEYV